MTQEIKNSGSVVNAEKIVGNVEIHSTYWTYKKLILNAEQKTIYFGVKSPDIKFVGRALDLQRLKSAITSPPYITVVTGLGGIGKTQLVRRYISENRSSYKHVICIDSQEHGSLEEAFRTLAKDSLNISIKDDLGNDRDISSIVKEVLCQLSESKTLIVLDNIANEQYINTYNGNIVKIILKMETFGERPHVVITSRIQEWSDSIHRIKLDVFESEDAKEFVLKTLDASNNKYDDSLDDIMALVEKLHSFPLALRQATAHIVHQRVEETFNIVDYINKYKIQEILDSPLFQKNILNTYEKTTFTTWRVTLDAIKQNSTVGEVAIRILYIIAYFDYRNIPRNMFFNLLVQSQSQPTAFFHFLQQLKRKRIVCKDTVLSAVRLLVNYSMIDGEEPQSVLSIHRLVQEVIKIELERNGQTKEILRDGLSLIQKYENIQEIHEHAILVFISAAQFTQLFNAKEFILFSVRILKSMTVSGKHYKVNYFVDEILKLFNTFFGEHHKNTLKIKLYVADLYRHLGKHSDALRIFQDVFDKVKKILGKKHSVTLITNSNIACSYRDLGQYSTALQIFQEVFEKQMKFLGEDHSYTLKTKSNIAQSYHDLGKHSTALKMFQELFEILKKHIDEEHVDMVNTKYNIANSYLSLRQHYLALQLFEDVFDQRKRNLGENHPDTLNSKYKIGETYFDLGKHSDALKIFEEVFEKRINILGENHPDTLDTKSNIGLTNGYLGKHSDALQIFQELLEKRKNILGKDHLDTLNTKSNIANSYHSLGKHFDALKIFEEVFAERKHILGDNHPHTLDTKCSIGLIKDYLGKHSVEIYSYIHTH